MDSKTLKAINARLEKIEVALELANIELPIKESEAVLSNRSLDAILSEWEEKGVKSKLANIIVAPENVAKTVAGDIGTEYDDKMYFTWGEAMELEEKVLKPNGWRLPTRSEWALLAEEFGEDEDGVLDGDLFRESLKLPITGYFWQGTLYDGITNAYYWSSVSCSTTHAFYLFFNNSGGLNPQYDVRKMGGFAVRCVKDIKKGE